MMSLPITHPAPDPHPQLAGQLLGELGVGHVDGGEEALGPQRALVEQNVGYILVRETRSVQLGVRGGGEGDQLKLSDHVTLKCVCVL